MCGNFISNYFHVHDNEQSVNKSGYKKVEFFKVKLFLYMNADRPVVKLS